MFNTLDFTALHINAADEHAANIGFKDWCHISPLGWMSEESNDSRNEFSFQLD